MPHLQSEEYNLCFKVLESYWIGLSAIDWTKFNFPAVELEGGLVQGQFTEYRGSLVFSHMGGGDY